MLLGAAALVLAIMAWRTHDSAILLVAVTTAVVAISWLFSRRSVMAALVPLGWASAGAFGPFASSVPVGVIGLAVSLAGTVVAVLSVADAWGARWASAGLMTRLSFGPFEKADIGAVGLMVAVIVVVAGGTSGALVRARSPLSLGNSRTITVESPDNSIGVHDISDVLKDKVAVAELGVLPVDLGPPFTGVTLIGATPDWISQAPMLMSGKPWVDVLSNPGSAVVSSDLLASPELTGKKVGDIVTLRDRTTGRLLPVVMAGVVDGSVAASTVWTNRATLTDLAAGGRVPVRFVLQPPHTKQVAVAIRQALGGRSVVVTTAAEAAGAARWSTARHIHDAGGHIVGGMWILGTLGVAVTVLRRAWRRMEELQSLRSVGAHRAIVGAVRRELLGLTGTGVVCGFLLGGIHAQLVTKAAGARWGTWQRALGDVVSGSALIVLTAAVVVMWTTRGARQRGGTRPARRTLRP